MFEYVVPSIEAKSAFLMSEDPDDLASRAADALDAAIMALDERRKASGPFVPYHSAQCNRQ